MKKLILSVTALAACSVGAYAQGVVYFDSSSAAAGTISINGLLNTTTDVNAELLTSTSAAGSYTPVAMLLLSSSNQSPDGTPGFDPSDIVSAANDIKFNHNGHITDQSGSFYVLNAAAGATEFFEVAAWTGNGVDSLAAAAASGTSAYGTSAAFSVVLGSSLSPIVTGLNNMPTLNLVSVPEPSTLAMAGVGLASMLLFRRRNK
jgi:hypothetical protein